MADDELEQLRREVRHLQDRVAIADCIAEHARGCDRHDADLLASTYFEDGVDVHGATVNAGPAYAAWANEVHAATSQNHLHNITTHVCEISGDEAHAESYVMVTLLSPDASTATVMCGRYIDRLERRDGRWRIALRRATVELAYTADARLLQSSYFVAQGYEHGTRDRNDLSYERPLSSAALRESGER
jgi:ketosteroid isomerase-like protein